MIPIGDSPNPRGTPWVTYSLIAINVAVFALISFPLSGQPVDPNNPLLREYLQVIVRGLPAGMGLEDILQRISAYDLFTFEFGFRPAAPSIFALLTSMFLHGGLLHLAGNMLFLWIYGDNVEHRLGRIRYLLAYLFTGIAATGLHAVLDLRSGLPTIGASGAISGVLGFYFVFFPRNKVRVLFLFFPFFVNVIQIPARIVLGIYLILDNILPFFVTRGMEGGGVAYGAHIGGFAAGLAIAWVLDRREMTARPKEYKRAVPDLKVLKRPGDEISDHVRLGEYEQAAGLYFALSPQVTRGLLSPEDSLMLGSWLADHGHAQAALTVFRRHIRDFPQGPGAAEAHLGAGYVQLNDFDEATSAYQHFLQALDQNPSPETASQARAGVEAVMKLQKFGARGRREPK